MGKSWKDQENAENMYQMLMNLLAEVITQGVSMIHVEFSKFFRAEYFNGESNKRGWSLALLRGIQQCFIDIQNHCVQATVKLLVNDLRHKRIFGHRSLYLRGKAQQWELSEFEPIGTHQEEITKKFSASKFERKVLG